MSTARKTMKDQRRGREGGGTANELVVLLVVRITALPESLDHFSNRRRLGDHKIVIAPIPGQKL